MLWAFRKPIASSEDAATVGTVKMAPMEARMRLGLKKALEGAASAGAETEMVRLYDLNFKGCVSCLGCKLRKEPRPNRCLLRDDLTAVLDRSFADGRWKTC